MKIIFDNGKVHDLTFDEVSVLRIALKGAYPLDVITSEEREAELNLAYRSLLDEVMQNTSPASKRRK